jgi:cytoskeletal protein CcmA (bactofilin family)
MKKSSLIFTVFLALFLAVPGAVWAYETRKEDSITVAKNETIDGNFYAAGANINIEGHIKGDLFCAGQSINISGSVDGSVFCAGQNINLDGPVAGSARLVASTVNINGPVGQNVNAFAATINFGNNAKAGWDMVIGAASANLNGQIGEGLQGGGANISINGKVGRSVKLVLGNKNNNSNLTVGNGAQIGGNLEYWASKDANISPDAKIAGEKIRKEFTAKTAGNRVTGAAGRIIFSIFSSLIIGLVLVSVWRKKIIELCDLMMEKIAVSISVGFLGLILAPFVFIILAITIIGAPLSLILLALWIIAIYVSKVAAGIFIGRALMEKYWNTKNDSLIWPMVPGIIILSLVCYIPFIGWIICFLAVLWSLGAMLMLLKRTRN